MSVGDLVVIPGERALGVGRIERFLDVGGQRCARVLLYDTGALVVRRLDEIAPCPPGVWPRS